MPGAGGRLFELFLLNLPGLRTNHHLAMIKSMTGFGKGEASFGTKKITVELRSLNSKQLDLNIKLPAFYRQSETELRNLVAQRLQRGFRGYNLFPRRILVYAPMKPCIPERQAFPDVPR